MPLLFEASEKVFRLEKISGYLVLCREVSIGLRKEKTTMDSKKQKHAPSGQDTGVKESASEQRAAAEVAHQRYLAQQQAAEQALQQAAAAQTVATTQATTVSQPEQTTTANTTRQASTTTPGTTAATAADTTSQAATTAAPAVPSGSDLYLTVPAMGISNSYVANTSDPSALENGAIHLPQTGFPWQSGSNTYIAGHVLGYSGTGSYLQFANLPNMGAGDMIYLSDSNGTTYTYRVFRTLTVTPYDTYVTGPVPGQTVVTLQTCIDPPAYDQRFLVQGELVSTG